MSETPKPPDNPMFSPIEAAETSGNFVKAAVDKPKLLNKVITFPIKAPKKIASFVTAVVRDTTDKLRGNIKGTLERVEMANHEMGHAALIMLSRNEIEKIFINPISSRIHLVLGQDSGKVICAKKRDYAETISGENLLVEDLLFNLGGAAYQDLDNPKLKDNPDSLSKRMTRNYAKKDYYMAKQILEESMRTPGQESTILKSFFDKLTDFFKKPEVRNMMNILSNNLIKHRKIKSKDKKVSKHMRKLLESEGVDMNSVQQDYDNLVTECIGILDSNPKQRPWSY